MNKKRNTFTRPKKEAFTGSEKVAREFIERGYLCCSCKVIIDGDESGYPRKCEDC